MDVIGITTIASGVASLVGKIVGIIKESSDESLKVDLTSNILDLQQKVFDIQTAALELQDENRTMRDKINILENNASKEDQIERIEGRTYGTYLDDNGKKYSICMRCWDIDKKIVQVYIDGQTGCFKCTHCENNGFLEGKDSHNYGSINIY